MALQIVLVFCLAATALADFYDPVQVVVGGRGAYNGEFPYQVSMQTGNPLRHYCGGSLIHPQWVLTAGHCITSGTIVVRAGKINIHTVESTEQTTTVLTTIKHPLFVGGVAPYDIAVFKLARPFQINPYVQTIALPARYSEPVGNAILSGWGSVSRTLQPSMPSILQTVTLPLMSAGTCKLNMYPPRSANIVHDTNVCTYSNSGSCSGDSGGPLVQTNSLGVKEIVGIVSWGMVPCGGSSPSVYVKVSSFIDFIYAQLRAY